MSASSTRAFSSNFAIGAGCYWGTEKFIKNNFQKIHPNSIEEGLVGFMSPDPNAIKNPSYRQVCSGSTTHVEVLNIKLSKDAANEKVFEDLIRFFFQFHDPTTLNQQGNDVGTQYASVIFTSDEEQERIATKVINELQDLINNDKINVFRNKQVHTLVASSNTFYSAHEEHQEYLAKNPYGYW